MLELQRPMQSNPFRLRSIKLMYLKRMLSLWHFKAASFSGLDDDDEDDDDLEDLVGDGKV